MTMVAYTEVAQHENNGVEGTMEAESVAQGCRHPWK